MPSLSDIMLARGCVKQIERIHGELIQVLSGLDAGLSFTGVREIKEDAVINEFGSLDPRTREVIHFSGKIPRLSGNDTIQTADGKKWRAVKLPQNAYLETDFDLIRIDPKDAQ